VAWSWRHDLSRIAQRATYAAPGGHVLDQGVAYHELGEELFYRRDTENTERYRRGLIRQLERVGHQVTLQPLPEAAEAQRLFRFSSGSTSSTSAT
jgi:hypothetical protein